MPHIKLQYSGNVKFANTLSELFQEIHIVLNQTAGIKVENCKSRAQCYTDFYIGNGEKENAFVHLDVSILEGRKTDVKKMIGNRLLVTLGQFVKPGVQDRELQITVEIRDIQREMYFKNQEASLRY